MLMAPEGRLVGLQLRDVKVSATAVVMVPPVATRGTAIPAGEAPKALVMPIEVAVVPGEIVAVMTAAAPFCIVFVFSPVSTHV